MTDTQDAVDAPQVPEGMVAVTVDGKQIFAKKGELVIADQHYKIKHVIKAHGGQLADFHEFVVTPQHTALITIYRKHAGVDLTSVGGPANGFIVSGVAQEIDIETGQLVWEWDSWAPPNPHVPLSESYQQLGVGDGGIDLAKAFPDSVHFVSSSEWEFYPKPACPGPLCRTRSSTGAMQRQRRVGAARVPEPRCGSIGMTNPCW